MSDSNRLKGLLQLCLILFIDNRVVRRGNSRHYHATLGTFFAWVDRYRPLLNLFLCWWMQERLANPGAAALLWESIFLGWFLFSDFLSAMILLRLSLNDFRWLIWQAHDPIFRNRLLTAMLQPIIRAEARLRIPCRTKELIFLADTSRFPTWHSSYILISSYRWLNSVRTLVILRRKTLRLLSQLLIRRVFRKTWSHIVDVWIDCLPVKTVWDAAFCSAKWLAIGCLITDQVDASMSNEAVSINATRSHTIVK